MAYNYVQAVKELGGRTPFDCWCAARKGTRFAKNLTPRGVTLLAAKGDEDARAAVEKFFVELTKARLQGNAQAAAALTAWKTMFVKARVLK